MKSYIWSIPTRIFHWLLVIGFVAAFILGDFDELRNLHFAFGAFVGTLIFFRILFGFIGPKYSNFKDFPVGIHHQKEFLKTFFTKAKEYAGHNPAASVIMLLILLIGLGCSISGFFLYATENHVIATGIDEELLEETHEILANIFLMLVILHLLGTAIDFMYHRKTGTLQSMLTGNKNIESENVQLKSFQKTFSIFWFLVPIIMFILAYRLPQNINEADENEHDRQYEQHKN